MSTGAHPAYLHVVPTFEDLHLKTPIAVALERLGWSADDGKVRETAPTVARGHNLVALTPPAPAYAAPALAGFLSRLTDGGRGLLLVPPSQLDEWGALVYELARETSLRVQVAHGTARVMRLLRADALDLVITTPETAVALATRSALRTEAITGLFLAWPESWIDEDAITPLMQDLPKDAQRIIYTAATERAGALTERYARKALTVGASDAVVPAGPVRTASVSWSRRVAVLAELVELLDPASLVVWTADRSHHSAIAQIIPASEPTIRLATGDAPTAGTIIAFDLPTPERLRQLRAAGEVVLLVPAEAESYVARIASPRRPLQLPSVLESVSAAATSQRAAIVRAIEQGKPDRGLLTLAPLFERYDPATVAAALFELWTGAGPPPPPVVPDGSATSKIYVGVGKKDGATANDLVAVLTKELRVDRTKIGRIELRDAYSLIEIPAQEAEKVAGALNGVTVRRKRVTARVDRGPTRTKAVRR
jgi:ATP-dependent RNA helicase DeaD